MKNRSLSAKHVFFALCFIVIVLFAICMIHSDYWQPQKILMPKGRLQIRTPRPEVASDGMSKLERLLNLLNVESNPRASICPNDTEPGIYSMKPINQNQNRTKLILFWNRPSDWQMTADACEYNDCVITDDKCNFPRSDAVLFHTPNLWLKYAPKRIPGQIFVYMSLEPPERMYRTYKDEMWKKFFNWTWSYRRDADIVQPYGEFKPQKLDKEYIKHNISGFISSKTKFAVGFVSHCNTESKRENYTEALQKYVTVDIFGKCGPFKCPPSDWLKCANMINNDYKFYVAFENSLCRDYVSEKALHMFNRVSVPITRGSAPLHMYLPPNSYIDTSNFSTVKQVAAYLQNVASNKILYRNYFQWRKQYKGEVTWVRGLCEFCKRLHNVDKFRGLYQDIHRWERRIDDKPVCNKAPTDFR